MSQLRPIRLELLSIAWSDWDYFSYPPRQEASPLQGYFPALKFASTHLYTWVERDTVRVKCLAQKYNRGLEPGPLAPESSTLTMRPLCLPAECRNGGNCIQGFHSDQLNLFQITITSWTYTFGDWASSCCLKAILLFFVSACSCFLAIIFSFFFWANRASIDIPKKLRQKQH